jgi:type IV secretion system protein VirB9
MMAIAARLLAFALAVSALIAAPARAEPEGPADPRVRTFTYAPDQVTPLEGHYGYQIMVEFGPDERIENVAIGDSLAWQVTPNRRADTLFLKPIERNATTNLAVVTSRRRYAFVLTAREAFGPDDPSLTFRVRFRYPETVAAAAASEPEPTVANAAYSVAGSTRNVPSRIFDDGTRTYMVWPADAATPAVFALSAAGEETVVNFSMRGSTMVVERVGPAFILRNGAERTLVFNDAWREPAPGPDAPKVRTSSSSTQPSWLRRMFSRRASTPR